MYWKTMHNLGNWEETETDVDNLIRDYDDTYMPLPNIESEPHLLISKVRKHYMEHMIKLLTTNYETNQRLLNKNIYIPSAIWKCAKKLEMQAAQSCMVVQLYRKSVVTMINEMKADTQKGRLYNKLYECLHLEPQNEKRTQTTVIGDHCQCNEKKRRRKKCMPPPKADQSRINFGKKVEEISALLQENKNLANGLVQKIPVVTNMQTDTYITTEEVSTSQPHIDVSTTQLSVTQNNIETESDDLMQQMEKMFQGESKDDDDLFSSTLIDDYNIKVNSTSNTTQDSMVHSTQDCVTTTKDIVGIPGSVIETHAAQIKSLDERLATLTGLLVNNEPVTVVPPQKVKKVKLVSKWRCEEYFLKKNLYELLYEIGDTNRVKLARIKDLYKQLFGEDSDDEEGILSPDESAEFVGSCKARIDGWVMAVLAPYYTRGRIQGKALYKSVARHLIELIYKCKQYPSKHEVTSFVLDFLENRGKIRCEADFKEFRIDNVQVQNYPFV